MKQQGMERVGSTKEESFGSIYLYTEEGIFERQKVWDMEGISFSFQWERTGKIDTVVLFCLPLKESPSKLEDEKGRRGRDWAWWLMSRWEFALAWMSMSITDHEKELKREQSILFLMGSPISNKYQSISFSGGRISTVKESFHKKKWLEQTEMKKLWFFFAVWVVY